MTPEQLEAIKQRATELLMELAGAKDEEWLCGRYANVNKFLHDIIDNEGIYPWLPIDTAPKDGTVIEVRAPGHYPVFVKWDVIEWLRIETISYEEVGLIYDPTEWRPVSEEVRRWVEGES